LVWGGVELKRGPKKKKRWVGVPPKQQKRVEDFQI